jgi:uncharacterized protein YndB with AHSA1/START domain
MNDGTAMTGITMPPAEETSPTASAADYQAVLQFDASPEAVFEALTTVAGLAGWWMPVSGAGSEGGELRFDSGYEDPLIIHVDRARRPMMVAWSVLACGFLPDWVGTRPVFTLSPVGIGGCELRFRHHGLTAQLECFTTCRAGWDQYLASLHDYVRTGRGRPQGSDRGAT